MTHSALSLSHAQFFLSLGFMLLFLALELGLAWVLLYFKTRTFGNNAAAWMGAYRFWVRLFALAFILSFAASMPVLIQFGSVWPGLMEQVGDVIGPMLAASMLSLFIFKSCFLGVMLFAQRMLSNLVHTLVVLMVALGVTVTAFWLVAIVAWMQVPTGVDVIEGHYVVMDWLDVLSTPALPWYAGLLLVGSLLTVAFFMLGVTCAQTMQRPVTDQERLAFRSALFLGVVAWVALVFVVVGNGFMTAEHQPAKAAAAAAYWESGSQPDLILVAAPSAMQDSVLGVLRWSHAGGRWLGRNDSGILMGLDQFSEAMPPVTLTFWSFRVAVLAGAVMLFLLLWVLLRTRRYGLDPHSLSYRERQLMVAASVLGWIMLLAGAAYVLLGFLPYLVGNDIQAVQVQSKESVFTVGLGVLSYGLVYVLCMIGFFQKLRHAVRFGVVPIARHRGRA
ncbi:cytochrome ubiquinol oxidase subunit I [Providencia rettgeri]|uniref:cytochrome ubiquinol oxidase subunit I n=1 Tax=Alcaligenes sp. SORT26 TaxID=2813780 RepID=UPI001A9DF201|nr:cytochrome ubiquinol oxidase subunit I [Alcaligenes sp. SORT26]MBY6345586.1 cytochrome ubiquinol oxidase subunit I [Providencia rettgeri]QTB99696.1 cytochrome ubiquinol oxidase subunit I [Alcaligenes sp. SORT26]